MADRAHTELAPDGSTISGRKCIGQYPEGCKANTVEYEHPLNILLVSALTKFYRHCRTNLVFDEELGSYPPVHVKNDLTLTYHEWQNFQKLRHFRLLAKAVWPNGKWMNGKWVITAKGVLFATGRGYCSPWVWSYRNKTLEYRGDPILISDKEAFGPVWTIDQWSDNARPHEFLITEYEAEAQDDDDDEPDDFGLTQT